MSRSGLAGSRLYFGLALCFLYYDESLLAEIIASVNRNFLSLQIQCSALGEAYYR